jgi:hypothetical protein
MRIAQIAPLDEAVPSKLYGGTERVVSYWSAAGPMNLMCCIFTATFCISR